MWKPWGKSSESLNLLGSGSGTLFHGLVSGTSGTQNPASHEPISGPVIKTGSNSALASGAAGLTSPISAQAATSPLAPMPSEAEVNAQFETFLAELALPTQKADQMRSMPADKKWKLLVQRDEKAHPQDNPSRMMYEPGAYVTLLQSGLSTGELAKELQSLDVAMRTQPISWVKQFLDGGGLPVLLRIITSLCLKKSAASVTPQERDAQIYAIRVMKAQMSSAPGLSATLNHPDAIKTLSLALNCTTLRTKTMGIEVLAAVCLIPPNGHTQVVHAFDYYQNIAVENRRFETLVHDLFDPDLENGLEATNYRDYQAAILTLFNVLCSTPDEIEVRVAIRSELLELGLAEKIWDLYKLDSEMITTQLSIFEDSAANDSELLSESISSTTVDMNDVDSVYAGLKAQTAQADAEKLLLRVLQNLLLLPNDNFRRKKYWELAALVLRQFCLQRHSIAPNVAKLSIDVETAVESLTMREGDFQLMRRGSITELTNPDAPEITRLLG
eukprot:jgi/Hompol1/1072/HPOL_001176-RA